MEDFFDDAVLRMVMEDSVMGTSVHWKWSQSRRRWRNTFQVREQRSESKLSYDQLNVLVTGSRAHTYIWIEQTVSRSMDYVVHKGGPKSVFSHAVTHLYLIKSANWIMTFWFKDILKMLIFKLGSVGLFLTSHLLSWASRRRSNICDDNLL